MVIFSFSSITVAAGNPFTVKVSFYNQTGKTQSFYGHQHGFYDDLSIKPIKTQILNKDITAPLVMTISPEDPGKLFRFKYSIAGEKGCLVDFVVTWDTPKDSYRLRNLHVADGDSMICPMSPVLYNKLQNQAEFSLAVIAI